MICRGEAEVASTSITRFFFSSVTAATSPLAGIRMTR